VTDETRAGPLTRLIQNATKVQPHELRATLLSFAFVFVLMTAYFILRPVRDAMSSDWSDEELSWLWTSTFAFSVVAVSLYGFVISHIRLAKLVPAVYGFFAASFVAFYLGSKAVSDPVLVDKAFYVWLSVFSLFHVSVFWSFMSGTYSKEQAPRLFGFIATGASTGAIVGPLIATAFAAKLGAMNLLLVAAALLVVPIPIIAMLDKLRVTELGNENLQADTGAQGTLGKNPFAGFMLFVRNPYLLAIGLFIIFYVIMNTFIYFELRKLLAVFDRDVRTQYWGSIDLAVNSLTIVTAMFATSRLTTRFGMGVTLALIPLLMVGGWLIVAASPVLLVLIGLQVSRRAGNYAITRPGREMLFTLVDPETRYKAKPVVDIVIYRGGDMATAWAYTAITATLGFGLTGVALIAAGVAAIWAVSGLYLGRTYDREKDE
jgi:AAA family ATP:ADP antiporter